MNGLTKLICAVLLTLGTFGGLVPADAFSGNKQYVMITFDGARNLRMWDATYDLGKKYDAQFTYFVSGVYFLSDPVKHLYHAPGKRAGRSAIGFGRSTDEVGRRVAAVHRAMKAGHEISSHANGHYRGGLVTWKGVTEGLDWSVADWDQEFGDFVSFLWNVYDNQNFSNGISEANWKTVLKRHVHGFRAPNLSVNPAMSEALAGTYSAEDFVQNFSYDSSRAKTISVPYRKDQGYWDLPLGLIKIEGSDRRTIAMDYNFYVHDSKAKYDPDNASKYRKRYYKSLLNYFNGQYSGSRGPVIIGNHFATWNDGAYYGGLIDFIKVVCVKPDVECITMAEYANLLNEEKVLGQSYMIQGLPSWGFVESPGEAAEEAAVDVSCSPESHSEDINESLLAQLSEL